MPKILTQLIKEKIITFFELCCTIQYCENKNISCRAQSTEYRSTYFTKYSPNKNHFKEWQNKIEIAKTCHAYLYNTKTSKTIKYNNSIMENYNQQNQFGISQI